MGIVTFFKLHENQRNCLRYALGDGKQVLQKSVMQPVISFDTLYVAT